MEEIETIEPLQPESPKQLVLTETAQYFLHQTSKWTKFLAIMGFIGAGILLLIGLCFGTLIGTLTTYQYNKPITQPFIPYIGFVYIFLAIFYFFASRYLYQFGERVKNGIIFQEPLQIENGFGKLRSLFKMFGITTIVVITIYIITVGFFILAIMLIKPQSVNYGL